LNIFHLLQQFFNSLFSENIEIYRDISYQIKSLLSIGADWNPFIPQKRRRVSLQRNPSPPVKARGSNLLGCIKTVKGIQEKLGYLRVAVNHLIGMLVDKPAAPFDKSDERVEVREDCRALSLSLQQQLDFVAIV
jgi:hypothetical protein